MFSQILNKLESIEGNTSFYYKNLVSGKTFTYHENDAFVAASVIKIPVMFQVFKDIEDGKLQPEQEFTVMPEDKKPSCGALNYMHDNLKVTLMDLCTLMIILSDNTATNMLIKTVGMENINNSLDSLGIKTTRVNRLLFDSEKAAQGIENYITSFDIGLLLEKMYKGELVSKAASEKMLSILLNQRLNGKMPFLFTDKTKIAHKTGEDTKISHDAGIVYAKEPFIAIYLSNNVNVPVFERFIQDTTFELAKLK